jgi:hypothetical protein
MKKLLAVVASIPLVIGLAGPVEAATGSQAVSGVSAYYRVDIGYKVGWQLPANRSNVAGYTVTANNGKTCVVRGATANQCTFSSPTLGYTGSFNFTVTTNLVSGIGGVSNVSNTVGARTIPSAPLAVTAETVSDTAIRVAWIPSSGTGNLPLYGYEVTYWKSDQNGQPITSTKQSVVVPNTYASLQVSPSTMYIINVASCNALGCNSANYWVNTATTPITPEIRSIVFPRVIGGGSASTTCFDSIYDANTGETALGSCGSVVADPSKYPAVVSSATTLQDPLLSTKFAQRATLSRFLRTYSLATWKSIGISWFANLTADSKSVTLGFTTPVNIYSKTPAVCEVVGSKIVLKAVGACSIEAQVGGDNTWLPSNTASATLTVTN